MRPLGLETRGRIGVKIGGVVQAETVLRSRPCRFDTARKIALRFCAQFGCAPIDEDHLNPPAPWRRRRGNGFRPAATAPLPSADVAQRDCSSLRILLLLCSHRRIRLEWRRDGYRSASHQPDLGATAECSRARSWDHFLRRLVSDGQLVTRLRIGSGRVHRSNTERIPARRCGGGIQRLPLCLQGVGSSSRSGFRLGRSVPKPGSLHPSRRMCRNGATREWACPAPPTPDTPARTACCRQA